MIRRSMWWPAVVLVMVLAWTAKPAAGDQDAPVLDGLFDALKQSEVPAKALVIEQRIWSAWLSIEDEQSARLMELGVYAMQTRQLDKALEVFDRLVEREPEFSEAWNKRATVYFMREEYRKSIADVRRTLTLEPRHFGALSGLGLIMMRLGREDDAISAFERALEIHPMMPGPRINLEVLKDRRQGVEI